jgi:hypothetical protein
MSEAAGLLAYVPLLNTLLNLLFGLEKRRIERNRNFYNDFIAPVQKTFDEIHEDYLGSFRRYRESILDGTLKLTPKHPVVDMAQQDSLFSAHLRSRINDYDPRKIKKVDESVKTYLKAIHGYLFSLAHIEPLDGLDMVILPDRKDYVSPKFPSPNIPRQTFLKGILPILTSRKPKEKKREAIVEVLDGIVEIIQRNQRAVAREHEALKTLFLDPNK